MKKTFFSLLFSAGIFLLAGLVSADWPRALETGGGGEARAGSAPVVALTFDDGPHPVYTEILLEGLRERGIKATFFLIGVNAEGHEDIVRQIADDGHLIGNHTYSHVQLTSISDEKACEEIDKANQVIGEACGQEIHYIRPPFGSWQDDLESLIDMQVVLWSVDPEDWRVQDTQTVVERVLSHVEDGDIILLHDVYRTSVEAALEIVDRLTEEGYEFVRVDELLLD